ncbi:MAG: homoserine kinase [bacterium]
MSIIPRTPHSTARSDAATPSRVVRAFAPGSIGNIGPGLDILGCAITGIGDSVVAWIIEHPGVFVVDAGHPDLPTDPTRHASAIAAADVVRRAGIADAGIALRVEKRLPLSGGQGGSAASAIAGAVAVNALFGSPLSQTDVLYAALAAEERVAGRHIDNLAPSLFGGILLIRSIDPLDVVRIPVPPALRVVLVHPAMLLRTADARAVLPDVVDRLTAMAQAAAVARMIAAFCTGDLSLLRGAIDDRIAEPARAPLLPGFIAAKRAALEAGALGCSISGGGPTAFALVDTEDAARRVGDAMIAAYIEAGVAATARVERIDERGAHLQAAVPTNDKDVAT